MFRSATHCSRRLDFRPASLLTIALIMPFRTFHLWTFSAPALPTASRSLLMTGLTNVEPDFGMELVPIASDISAMPVRTGHRHPTGIRGPSGTVSPFPDPPCSRLQNRVVSRSIRSRPTLFPENNPTGSQAGCIQDAIAEVTLRHSPTDLLPAPRPPHEYRFESDYGSQNAHGRQTSPFLADRIPSDSEEMIASVNTVFDEREPCALHTLS